MDIEKGGARFNWIMPSFVGAGNLADSLFVIKELIFDKKKYSFADLRKMLEANFEGYEKAKQELEELLLSILNC